MDVGVGIIIIIPLRVVRSKTTFWQPQMEDKKEKKMDEQRCVLFGARLVSV